MPFFLCSLQHYYCLPSRRVSFSHRLGMELENPNNGDDRPDLANSGGNGGSCDSGDPCHLFVEDGDSACSTPYVSAPSSPGRGAAAGYFFSAPASPMHYVLSSAAFSPPSAISASSSGEAFEFEFSSRCPSPSAAAAGGLMCSADELFLNGQIRPMKLSSHLQRPQVLAPLLDVDDEEGENREGMSARGRDPRLRSRSVHRRTRSLSPLRNPRFQWAEDEEDEAEEPAKAAEMDPKPVEGGEEAATPSSGSGSSSRSSSSGRNAKRWIFLKDLLYRSKSEGRERDGERVRGAAKDKFWHTISFSPSSKDKSKPSPAPPPEADKPRQKVGPPPAPAPAPAPAARSGAARVKRRGSAPSPHERLYTANRAQAEDMRRRTFLPYRQGLLGCLGFTSRSYGAMNGLARTLNPTLSSRKFSVVLAEKWKKSM